MSGIETYVLQLGLDDESIPKGSDPWRQVVREMHESHLYVPVPRPTKGHQRSRFFYGGWLRKYAARLREVYRIAEERWGRPDILHAHVSLPGGYLAASLGSDVGVPVIVQEHYSGFESDARFFWRPGGFVREMGRNIQGFYAVSPGFARRITQTGLVTVNGVLPNPVDTDLFRPARAREGSDRLELVTAGSISLLKGTDVLLQALMQLPTELDWRLQIFGSDSQRVAFSQWLEDSRISSRVEVRGVVPQHELAAAFARSDVYVVASRSETANISMLQAMSSGARVVTTACGGPETLIDDSVGITVKANDVSSLVDGIVRAALNRDRNDRRATHRFVVDRFSMHSVAKLVLDVYRTARSCYRARVNAPVTSHEARGRSAPLV